MAILLQQGIAHPPTINYRNYELQIVEKYGVVLEGFPLPHVINPEKAGSRKDIEKIWKALRDGSCKWVKLTEAELNARVECNLKLDKEGKSLYHHRKSRQSKTLGEGSALGRSHDNEHNEPATSYSNNEPQATSYSNNKPRVTSYSNNEPQATSYSNNEQATSYNNNWPSTSYSNNEPATSYNNNWPATSYSRMARRVWRDGTQHIAGRHAEYSCGMVHTV